MKQKAFWLVFMALSLYLLICHLIIFVCIIYHYRLKRLSVVINRFATEENQIGSHFLRTPQEEHAPSKHLWEHCIRLVQLLLLLP